MGYYPDFAVARAWRAEADLYFMDIKNAMQDRYYAASPMTMQCKEYF
jgi:hypothetical protein